MTLPPPIELLTYASERLGDLCSEVVFLGGAIVGLLVTEPGAAPPRATKDVDVAIEINSQMEYYALDNRLLALGFTNDMRGPMCRYLHGAAIIDVIPVNPAELGQVNNWYPLAIETAAPCMLPNGISINLIAAECFLGTKLVAFSDPKREYNGDIFLSRDFGDIIRVLDGRSAIVSEISRASSNLRSYLQNRLGLLFDESYLKEAIAEHVDAGREELVIERIRSIIRGAAD